MSFDLRQLCHETDVADRGWDALEERPTLRCSGPGNHRVTPVPEYEPSVRRASKPVNDARHRGAFANISPAAHYPKAMEDAKEATRGANGEGWSSHVAERLG